MAFSVASTYRLDKPILQGLTSWSSSANHTVGYEVNSDDGRKYEYVFVSTTMTAAPIATYPAFYFEGLSQTPVVTTTHDGDLGRSFGGVLCALLAAGNNYGWMQTRGIVPSCAVSSSVAAIGDTLGCREAGQLTRFPIQSASTNPDSTGWSTPDLIIEPILGTAMQATDGGLADVMLHGRGR